ncbi:MAG: ABC-type transport auxiliary lipoprotein family protein [Thermoanaerobaculia bacterium]
MRATTSLWLLAACVAAGCSSGGLPVTRYYTLDVPGEVQSPARPGSPADLPALAVEALRVSPPYDQDRLVYRASPSATEVGFYSYHRWAAPLGRLAQVALVDALQGIDGVASVREIGSREFDLVLGGRIVHVEEIASALASEARIAIELSLRTDGGDQVWAGSFNASEPGRFANGGEVGRALHRVFQGLVAEAKSGLEQVLAASASPATR